MQRIQPGLRFFEGTQLQFASTREGKCAVDEYRIAAQWRIDSNICDGGLAGAIPVFEGGFGIVLQKINRAEKIVRECVRWVRAQRGAEVFARFRKVIGSECLA